MNKCKNVLRIFKLNGIAFSICCYFIDATVAKNSHDCDWKKIFLKVRGHKLINDKAWTNPLQGQLLAKFHS